MKVVLTDSEWMSLIDGSEDRDGLGYCCANISALRDVIIGIARQGGCIYEWEIDNLKQKIGWNKDHGLENVPAMVHLCSQLGISLNTEEHRPRNCEE